MRIRGALLGIALGAAPATAVLAQQPADPIDAILQGRTVSKDADPEEPDTAATGARVEPDAVPAAPPPAYRPPPGYRPPPSRLSAPVFLHETGKNPDAPPSYYDQDYNSRIRASAAAARGYQGPLEGGWTLSSGHHEIYVFELADHDGFVEGAWRDLRRVGALDGSGFIDGVERRGADLTFRFAQGRIATLHPAGDGRFSGELTEGGRTESVSLRRNP